MKKRKLTEFGFIDIIKKKFQKNNKGIYKGIGDDTAIIKLGHKYILYTCDAVAENVHFLKQSIKPFDLGRKAIAVNLSDIAAVGGVPKYCLVSLFLPANITEQYIENLYDGIIHECDLFKVNVIGGNISKANQLIIDIFMIGESHFDPILRSGAKVGDAVLVTGRLGDAPVIPTPRVREGQIIGEFGANAMIDISDGLSSDISHICDESQIGLQLFADKLPTFIDVDSAMNRGEDYELCFTIPQKFSAQVSEKIQNETGTKVTVIGEIMDLDFGRWLIYKDGKKKRLEAKGWDHFRQT